MAHEIYVLDAAGNPANALNGVPVPGALPVWKGLSYTPAGAAIDKIAQNKVSLPLAQWQSLAVGVNVQLAVVDTDLGAWPTGEVARGPVVDEAVTVDADGTAWAALTFADALYELAEVDTTSGFATAPGEALATTGARLLSLANHPWAFLCDVTGLDGIAFTDFAHSVAQAFGKLAGERFAHFRREGGYGTPRVLRLGPFGAPFTVGGAPLWLTAPGADATAAPPPDQRAIHAPRVTYRRAVTNALTVTGAGTGTAELTLRPVYGNAAIAGYDPAHPVLRRPRQDGGGFDGFDYYLRDDASIAANGAVWGRLQKADIGPVVGPSGAASRVDEVAAATALYTVGLASLRLSKDPAVELSFATPGVGDLRNIGGMAVHVQYRDYAFDTERRAYTILDLDRDFVVLEVVRTVADDGTAEDAFTLSTSGQFLASASGVLIGGLDAVTALHAATQSYPYPVTKQKAQPVGPRAPLRLYLYADNSVVRQHWMYLYVTLEGVRHTRNDLGHTQDVVTGDMPHDVAALPHDVAALPSFEFEIGGAAAGAGQVNYDPRAILNVTRGTPPATAHPVYFDAGNRFFYVQDGGTGSVNAPVASQTLQIFQTNPTAGGTGGKVVPTTGAATGTGQAGGTVPKKTHKAADGFGAVKVTATVEEVYEGPLPTGVTVWVDNTQVAGPFDGVAALPPIDLNPYTSDQAAHTIEVRAATDGNADASIEGRRDVTTLATKATG